jgi:hypothetical protein
MSPIVAFQVAPVRHPTPAAAGPMRSAFPITALAPPFRGYAEEGAIAVGVPVEMVAVPLIVAFGAAMGHHLVLRLKSGFHQLPVLFAGVVAPPGSAKSPAQAEALRPLRNLQHFMVQAHQDALQQAGANVGGGKQGAPLPTLDHLYTSDATMEAIAPMLVTSSGLLVYHDELLGLIRSCDAYRSGRGADRQGWLTLWSGGPIKVDRKSAPTIYVAHPAVSVLGGTQPEMLREFRNPNGGRDGLTERFLWIYPDTTPAFWTTETVSQQTIREVTACFLAQRRASSASTTYVDLAPSAVSVWIDWYNANQMHVAQLDGLEAGFVSKLPLQVARLALICHAMSDPYGRSRQLNVQTLDAAIALGEYFHGQFRGVLPLINGTSKGRSPSAKTAMADALSDAGRLSRSQLHRVMHGGMSSQELDQVLADLESEGRVIKENLGDTGGRPAEYWRWISEKRSEAQWGDEVA